MVLHLFSSLDFGTESNKTRKYNLKIITPQFLFENLFFRMNSDSITYKILGNGV